MLSPYDVIEFTTRGGSKSQGGSSSGFGVPGGSVGVTRDTRTRDAESTIFSRGRKSMQGLTDVPADRVTHIMKNRMYVKISPLDTVTERT
jgi:hypothetical protein